ncbi:hypothetical protein PAXINDRAFT_16360 [Paxillus involutus ATCC 200175]|uniref:Uncharacterized protein n=1 Tax=Paxillus involutus ATCC 200175 TaxID=664439 RepID=A0A0C9TIW3_PAXIN|nr:hypothetical protein PAXINDRAFT_16360 [Paxillus involutus ATCC 200175]
MSCRQGGPPPAAAGRSLISLSFSRPPEDVTGYVKGKGQYADDTTSGFSDVYKCMLDKPGEPNAAVSHVFNLVLGCRPNPYVPVANGGEGPKTGYQQ